MHGELPPRDQDAAVARYEQRKVVVATNVAETSLTIDGIRCVIDSGLARIRVTTLIAASIHLLIDKISRAAADQRTGRAGRTAPGLCLRLWSEEEQGIGPPQELPEVKRLDLAEVVLTLKAAGVEDLRSSAGWNRRRPIAPHAETLLKDLGAIAESDTAITPLGRRMLAFPPHPATRGCFWRPRSKIAFRAVALIAALSQGRNLLRRSNGKKMDEDRADLFGEKAVSDFLITDAGIPIRRAGQLQRPALPGLGCECACGPGDRADLRAVFKDTRARKDPIGPMGPIGPMIPKPSPPRKPFSAVCSQALPINWRCGSMAALSGATWSMAGRGCLPAKVWSITVRFWWLRTCGRCRERAAN